MCPECHHMPSGRFDAAGMQCYCRCHDVADAAPELLGACKALIESHGMHGPCNRNGCPSCRKAFDRGIRAIADATGLAR